MSGRMRADRPHGQTDAPPAGSLEERVRETLLDPDRKAAEDFLGVVCDIMPELRNDATSKYLEGKIQKIRDVQDKAEQKRLCKALTPYLDWYLQGL